MKIRKFLGHTTYILDIPVSFEDSL